MRRFILAGSVALAPLTPLAAQSHAAGGGHGDGIVPVILALAVMLTAAKLGGHLVSRVGQPPVLGELIAGVVLGNLSLLGVSGLSGLADTPGIEILAQLGVLILLFQVGLESTVPEMMKVGLVALLVAVLGVVTPFALGWGVGLVLLPGHSPYVHAFLGATLTATSVGITARVLADLGKSKTPEARVILGAAVVDDVLGLVILAIVSGAIQAASAGREIDAGHLVGVVLKAVLFLVGALALGVATSKRLFGLASRLRGGGVLLVSALVFCFVLAYLASLVGLAPIVGAYAAGLILEDVHFREFRERATHRLEELLAPLGSVLVPVFFVLMGMRVDLAAFGRVEVLGLAAALTVAAFVGKQACSLGAYGGLDRLTVGLGMVPRGEVGLIFAGIGLTLTIGTERIIDEALFSAVVIMVIVTTMIAPPALKWSLARADRRRAQQP